MFLQTPYSILCALMLAGVWLSGCAAQDPFEDWSDAELAERVEQMSRSDRPQDIGLPQRMDAADGLAGYGALDAYIASALRNNPDIRAARQRVERLRERVPQATALPDPMATFTFGELAQTAAGQVDYIVGVQQSLPFPGTLDARGEVARQEVMAALHAMQVVIDEVAGDVRRAYWTYDGTIREIEVLEESRNLLKQVESAVNARVRVGNAGQADQLRISREIAALENQVSDVRRRQQTASAMLARLTSRPAMDTWRRGEDSQWHMPGFDVVSLKNLADQKSPKVAEAQARVRVFHHQYTLARRDRKPDFMVGFQYGAVRPGGLAPSANGDDQIAGTVGVSIPLSHERYDASEREALRGMGESLARVRAAQDRVAYQIDEAIARIEAADQSLRRLRERMMPDAQQTIEVAISSFRTGDADFIQLLEDWRVLLDDRLQEARMVTDLHKAVADLEQAVGGSTTQDTTKTGYESSMQGDT